MIRGIAAQHAAFIAPAILRIFRRERAQAGGCEQFALHDSEHAARVVIVEHAVLEADGEELIGAYGGVARIAVDHVIQAVLLSVPELAAEAIAGAFREFAERASIRVFAEFRG